MKRYGLPMILIAVSGTVLLGARGCTVWAETDAAVYEANDAGVATLHNDSRRVAYLGGCATFNYEKLQGEHWVDMGPDVTCFWEGNIRRVDVGGVIARTFDVPEPGEWRLRYDVAYGCSEGVPLSEAGCRRVKPVHTDTFVVLEGPESSCDDLEAEFVAVREQINHCAEDGDCAFDHNSMCPVGGCYTLYNGNEDLDELDKIVTAYEEQGCQIVVCSCMPPGDVSCDGGTCTMQW